MIDSPTIVETGVRKTAVIHLTIPRTEVQKVMGPGLKELMGTLAKQGVKPGGPWFTHHFKMDPGVFDFEIGVPVEGAFEEAGRVRRGELPAATVARTVYHGGYEGLPGAWGEFEAWIKAQGRKSAVSLWETYLTDPSENPDPATWRTELTRPLIG